MYLFMSLCAIVGFCLVAAFLLSVFGRVFCLLAGGVVAVVGAVLLGSLALFAVYAVAVVACGVLLLFV